MSGTSRSISDLHPLFQPIAREILALAQNRITAKFPGSIIKPSTTFRTLSAQATVLAAGKSTVPRGYHQYGLAMDVAIINPEGAYVTEGKDERYRIFGMAAMEHGCIWGGNWQRFPDASHCEYHPEFNLETLMSWLDEHRVTA